MRLCSSSSAGLPRKIRYVVSAFLAVVALAATAPAWGADWASVVMYHRVGESDLPATNIALDQFDAHIAELTSGAYTVLPLPEIIQRLRDGVALPDRTVAITIDDAFLSVYREAWPRLRAAGLPFTLFVSTDSVDKDLPGFMSWDQIRELVAGGVTIGSQTRSHPHMPLLDDAANAEELRQSNARFMAELGQRPTLFAYPYGEYGTAVQRVVTEAGFVAAFGQQSGALSAQDDLYGLPRWAMNEHYGDLDRFRMAVNALPFRVSDVTPPDRVIKRNPPAFGFTLTKKIKNIGQLACYSSYHGGPVHIERLGDTRFEVRLKSPFPPGRARINCTVPGPDGRWRWLGVQFYVPRH